MSVDCGQVQFRWLDCATPQVGVGCGAALSAKSERNNPARNQGQAHNQLRSTNDHQHRKGVNTRVHSQNEYSKGLHELDEPCHLEEQARLVAPAP